MLVMGSVIGAGIFAVPHDVAELVHTPALILTAWVLGGVVSLSGSLVYADLSRRRPQVGGQYAFLREAYHPVVAFLYGWCLLWVVQSGGMASVAVVFARYFLELGHLFAANHPGSLAQAIRAAAGAPMAGAGVAAVTIAGLTALNCLGVRTGSTAQKTTSWVYIGCPACRARQLSASPAAAGNPREIFPLFVRLASGLR
jgi:APA family basic amino acid/polyamine antiporter